MTPRSEILAKSRPPIPLFEHLEQVAAAAETIAKGLGFNSETARLGGILHDIGKAHPTFQAKIRGEKIITLHRHEFSSLLFLPLFDKKIWPELVEMVVAHHKSIIYDPSDRGFLQQFEDDFDEALHTHLHSVTGEKWEVWSPKALEILAAFRLPIRSFSKEEAELGLQWTLDYCLKKKKIAGWSPFRGLLMAADHLTSALNEDVYPVLPNLFKAPDLSTFRNKNNKNGLYPLADISAADERKHTLLVAPTGAGKTDFMLKRCKGRAFYTLPFQASINAMHERIKAGTPPGTDVRLLHAASKVVLAKNNQSDEAVLQPFVGAAVKVLTPHQLAPMIFGISGFEAIMLDVRGCDVILDEIHTYNDQAQAMVVEIVRTLLRLDCRIHIGTATMPCVLYNSLLELLGGKEQVYEVKLSDEQLDEFNRHIVHKLTDESEVLPLLQLAFANNEKVLLVYNTVKKAQEVYQELTKAFPAIDSMLIHSRFRRKDRSDKETQLKDDFNKKTVACFVVSTQVVEVSLDISFDRMITQAAPLDALIQRFGRINRARTKENLGKLRPIHVLPPAGKPLPYKKEIVQTSFDSLPNGELLPERDLQTLLNGVYPSVDYKSIDVHLIWKNGKYGIAELCSTQSSVLIDALEIEGAVCILEEDRPKYEDRRTSWLERQELEIPVSWRALRSYAQFYPQVNEGARPWVIDGQTNYDELGLILKENDFMF